MGCAAAASLRADPIPPGAPTQFSTLPLKDRRTLHHVRVRSDGPDSILVLCDEGMVQIRKALLPDEIARAYPLHAARTPTVVVSAQPAQVLVRREAAPKPAPETTPTRHGCTIVAFEPHAFRTSQGAVSIVIRNETDSAQQVYPGELVAITTSGERFPGRFFVADGESAAIKPSETIAAHADISELLTFTNDPIPISFVQWAH